jgi:hypothetical protein
VKPTFCYEDNKPHILGIGSILFMATEASHVWGSGILDPRQSYPRLNPDNVHAVRGTLTRDLLRKNAGLKKEVALGDPGVFIDMIPEINHYKVNSTIKHRVAVIPHFRMFDHPYFADLAKSDGYILLDARTDRLDFIKQIIDSEVVVSQSLHGLIFAELLGKPYSWISHANDEVWNFKFLDWFTNTFEPPKAPNPLGTTAEQLLGNARLSGLRLDRNSLRTSLPTVPLNQRSGTIGFREARRNGPVTIRITGPKRMTSTFAYNETVWLPEDSEPKLRQALNDIARLYDEPTEFILVFDEELYGTLTIDEAERIRKIIDVNPELHFVAMEASIAPQDSNDPRPIEGLNTHKLKSVKWSKNFEWRGVAFLRHGINFSFETPGALLVRVA